MKIEEKIEEKIVAIRTPMNKTTHEELIAIDLSDGSTIIRTNEQFAKDLRGSHLTLSIAEAASNPKLNRIKLNDLVDGRVKHSFLFQKEGSEFIAEAEYVKSLVNRTSNNIRNVKLSDGTTIAKIPAIGDRVIKSKDGYVPKGFLDLSISVRADKAWYAASQVAVAEIESMGRVKRIDEPSVETVSAVE